MLKLHGRFLSEGRDNRDLGCFGRVANQGLRGAVATSPAPAASDPADKDD
jgi:hypothetical protein